MRIHVVQTDAAPRPLANYNQAFRVGDLVWAAGQIASDYRTGVPPGNSIRAQTRYVLENIEAVLKAGGSDLAHAVRAHVFMKDLRDLPGFAAVWEELFPDPPPCTIVQCGPKGLLVPGTLIEIDLIAVTRDSVHRVERASPLPGVRPIPGVHTAQACRWGDFIFVGGLMAADAYGAVPEEASVHPAFPYYGSPIERQAEYVLERAAAVLRETGSSMERVVKAHVFLRDLRHFHTFDEVWRKWFPSPPARTTLQTAALPVSGALVAVDLIAAAETAAQPEPVSPAAGAGVGGHDCPAVRFGGYIFASGMLAGDHRTGIPPEARVNPDLPFHGSDIQLQTAYVLERLQHLLESAGSSLDNTVKTQVFMTDLDNFYAFDKVWKRYFKNPPPRTTTETAGHGLLVPGALVEVDLIALDGEVPSRSGGR